MGKPPIRNNIRALRFNHSEMTQQELADQVGVTRQTIIAIEKGQYSPSLELAFRIARVFGSPLENVFSFDENIAEYRIAFIWDDDMLASARRAPVHP
jgi:putative transcriptional regulator